MNNLIDDNIFTTRKNLEIFSDNKLLKIVCYVCRTEVKFIEIIAMF